MNTIELMSLRYAISMLGVFENGYANNKITDAMLVNAVSKAYTQVCNSRNTETTDPDNELKLMRGSIAVALASALKDLALAEELFTSIDAEKLDAIFYYCDDLDAVVEAYGEAAVKAYQKKRTVGTNNKVCKFTTNILATRTPVEFDKKYAGPVTLTVALHSYEIVAPWYVPKLVERCNKPGIIPSNVYKLVYLKGVDYNNHGYAPENVAMYYTKTGDRGTKKLSYTFDNGIVDFGVINTAINDYCDKLARGIATTVEVTDGETTVQMPAKFKKHIWIDPKDIIERTKEEKEKELRNKEWWNDVPGFYSK